METSPTHDTIWTVDDALAFLRSEKSSDTTQWEGFCLKLSANAYGYTSSNVDNVDGDRDVDVADYRASATRAFKHEGDRHPPVGGLAICRLYTDARIQRIYGGTSEIMREIIARTL
jgi:hypothetical protein